ncbi:nucleolar GTP-binding protein 2 [Cyclospora cayetanensis]|uniref:Nucleolar GTP-binding protein 2 n=1 Tax=Cyclospora cayetanensis TaxID=88456 RepID=A0A6P6S3D1_9EIME|nr:nucleolar GTP-binding protein 2 [Cyclospora cayetanensis]
MAKVKKQSRRQKLSKKYNIEKKVREHRRKMRKEAKAKGGPVRRKLRRDPGIPNSCPFKGEIVANMLRRKKEKEARLLQEREEKRQQQVLKQQQQEKAATTAALHDEGQSNATQAQKIAHQLAATNVFEAAAAAEGPSEADLALQSIAATLSLCDSAKQQHVAALQRQQQQQLRQLLAASDIIIHVLDARLPLAFRCAGLERWAHREGKKVILLLNKIDLLPAPAVAAWLQQLRRTTVSPVLAFKCSSSGGSGCSRIGRWCAADPVHAPEKLKRSSSQALGVQPLMRLLSSIGHAAAKVSSAGDGAAAETAAGGEPVAPEDGDSSKVLCSSSSGSSGSSSKISSKAFMTVGVVGYPNVGKSSVVNALTRSASAGVAALPGSTRQLKFIKLDSKTQLIDSPGVLFAPPAREEDTARILPHPQSLVVSQQQQKEQQRPLDASASLLLQSLLPVPQIPNPEAVAEALISISSVPTLQQLYQLPIFTSPREALQGLAMRRGKLLKGGVADLCAAAKMFLQEWQEGKVPYYSLPSGFKDSGAVRLVGVKSDSGESLATLQKELVERQLASLGVSSAEGELCCPDSEATNGPAQTLQSVQGEMRLMFRDVLATKRQREQTRTEAEAPERMEHVTLRQKKRKMEKKHRRAETATLAAEVS